MGEGGVKVTAARSSDKRRLSYENFDVNPDQRSCIDTAPNLEGIALGRREYANERRHLGAYYTSGGVADILCSWAIRSANEKVLEPSFGGCEFITSAHRRLMTLGAVQPLENICGVDVDLKAFDSLGRKHGGIVGENFHHGDFLAMPIDRFGEGGVDVIVGNPPYVRHHAISKDVASNAARLRDLMLLHLPMQANLWAFFVLHATNFLRPAGRMAWILPQNYLYASYAKPVRAFLHQHFRSVIEIEVKQHLFENEGTYEKSVLVFCEDWQRDREVSALLRRLYVETIDEVERALNDCKLDSMLDALPEVFSRYKYLGDLCDIKIGLVLGDARFFLFDQERAREQGIGQRYLKLVATGATVLRGLQLRNDDLAMAFTHRSKVGVLDTSIEPNAAVEKYLASMSVETISQNATFNKRKVWHQPLVDAAAPDGFFTGMSHNGPRLVLNPDGVLCTNSLYEVRFKEGVNQAQQRQIALWMISTPGQLCSEFEGRPYGSGLLKHEPSDARRIRVFEVVSDQEELEKVFDSVNSDLRNGYVEAAEKQANEFFIKNGTVSSELVVRCRGMILKKRQNRHKRVNKS